jgi:hypothetical protein
MLMALIVAGVNAPSCDPGSDFALLSGAALALRGRSAIGARRNVLDLSPVAVVSMP